MGSGKTSIGQRLAAALQLRFIDTDQQVEEAAGASVSTIFELEGEAGFRRREASAIAEALSGASRLVATGGGAVLAEANRQLLRERSFVAYLRVGIEQQLERLARDRARPLLAGDDRHARLQELAQQRDRLYVDVADLVFEPGQASLASTVTRLRAAVATQWLRGNAT